MAVEHGDKIWVDGRILPWAEGSRLSVLTHSLHYGVGAFEGIRAYKRAGGETCVFRLGEHIQRLFDSCKLVLMEPNVSFDAVRDGCVAVLRESKMQEGYLRPLMLLGTGAMGLLPSDNPVQTIIVAWKWGAYLGAEALEHGIRCKVSSHARHSVSTSFPRGKLTGQYINSVVAKREAKLAGYDEAILLDVHGNVSEGSGENVFIVKDGALRTPPLSSSILAGITRDSVMRIAEEEGLVVHEDIVTREELFLADEAFLTGTAAEVTPVREVDGRVIGAGKAGPITKRLQQRYFDVVRGSDDSHPEWLTRV